VNRRAPVLVAGLIAAGIGMSALTVAGAAKPTTPPTPGTAEAATTARADAAGPSEVERGRYLALAGDCAGCHTAPGGKPFAGGLAIETGLGEVYTPNITPDRQTGIGGWSSDDFYAALHLGHDDEGNLLYPAFPYPWFTRVTRADVDAIKAFLDTVAPVHAPDKPPQLEWWMSWRPEVATWDLLYFRGGEYQPDKTRSAQWNRGAYLVEGLGHCGDCHTQKSSFGGAVGSPTLAGGYTEAGQSGWFAPSLRSNRRSGLGRWSVDDVVQYLKTGSNARTASAGPMSEVVRDSTSHLRDADLTAIAVYLRSLAPGDEQRKPEGLSRAALERGQEAFTDNCAACHMQDGNGIRGMFPALAGSSAIQARQPATVLRVVLQGARVPSGPAQRPYVAMPAFGRKLDDTTIADVVTYIRNAWGNRASPVDAGAVERERQALASARP
jgi:mono/diheme cytochrome c family protein